MLVGNLPYVSGLRLHQGADRMRRREVVMLLGGAAAWTLPARAEPLSMPVIGYLGPESPAPFASRLKAFREGLAENSPKIAMSRSSFDGPKVNTIAYRGSQQIW